MELFVISATILLVLVQNFSCQKLVAVEVAAKLGQPTYSHASLYDGDDKIYILGGYSGAGFDSNVYSYSLDQDEITEVATFSNILYHGFPTFNDQRDILYIGGFNSNDHPDGNIYRLQLSNWDLTVEDTNRKFGYGRGIKAIGGSIIFIPTNNGTMFCLNLSTFESCGTIPLRTAYYTVRTFVHDRLAYLIGTNPPGFIEIVNLETMESILVDAKLPLLSYHDVVFDGVYAYILGSRTTSGSNHNGIIRLNPRNLQFEVFIVENFPVNQDNPESYWFSGSAVYVEKWNRIYFSGGFTNLIGIRNEILYIDLVPISEPTSTTPYDEPSTTEYYYEPSTTPYDEPSTTDYYYEPSTTPYDEPSTTDYYYEPSTTPYDEPSTTDYYYEPSTTPYDEPSTTDYYYEPSTTPYDEPSTTDYYYEPSTTPYDEPSTTDYYYEPSTTPYDEPSTTDYYYEPSTTPYDEPSTTDYYYEPSTTTQASTSTTLNPDIFTCLGKPQGFYPNPYDCARFIACHNGTEEFYVCPEPLLFSPILLSCTNPEDVDCDISCAGKPDGMYVHPHDCSLFINCNESILDVYKCPEPLLFDPVTRKCNFPEEVQCRT